MDNKHLFNQKKVLFSCLAIDGDAQS